MEDLLSSPILWIIVAAASEIVGLNPKWKANSIIQIMFQLFSLLKPKKN
jgi:hypothetical protein